MNGTCPAAAGEAARTPVHRLRWVVAAVVLAANVVDVLDATIVNVAAPSIHRDLGGGDSTIQWLGAGYTLAFAVLLIAGARLGDILGRRRLFLVGLAGFTGFSAACAVAPDVGALIAFRALQGGFGALMIPQGFGLLKQVFTDDEEFDRTLAMFGPLSGVAMLAAPVLAGVLVSADLWGTGWRLAFLINVPVGAVMLPAAFRALPRAAARPEMKLDVTGVWLVGLALVAIIYPLVQGRPDGWPSWTLGLAAAGVGLLLVFLRHERRRPVDQLIEPTLLTNRTYLSGLAVALMLFGAYSGLLLCVSLYGQLGEGWSAIHAALVLTPVVLGMIGGMVGSQALVHRLGRRLLQVGIVLVAAGAVALALALDVPGGDPTWDLVPGLLLVGAGLGATTGQLFSFILSSVTMDEVGSASGVLEATQQLSTALGVAVLGTVFFSSFDPHLPAPALRITAWACLVPLVVAYLLVFRLPRHLREQQDDQTSSPRRSAS